MRDDNADRERDGARERDASSHENSRRSVLRSIGGASAAGLLGTGASAGLGAASDDPDGCPGAEKLESPRPGPSVLYDDPVTAPQFEPTDEWRADPILVSGRTAYDDGEFLYQGWPFDDHGASADQPSGAGQAVGDAQGDLAYPTDEERYANNAADFLEIRVRPTDDGVAYRIALNTMIEPDAAVVAIGIDAGSDERTDWGHGLGELGAGVDHVLVTWGTGATLDGEPLAEDQYGVDVDRNRFEVEVSLDPGRATWRHHAVAGVHDGDGDFAPVQSEPDERNPGGAFSDEPPVFDVGFRTDEDEPLDTWRESAQADALGDRDISAFGVDVDFGRLRDGDVDRSIPQQGYFNRLYASRYDLGDGIDVGADNRTTDSGVDTDQPWTGLSTDDPRTIFRSRVQPYSLYVPESYESGEPSPVVVLPHSLGQNYNQYADTPNLLRQIGEQRDAIVIMFQGRGPSGWWKNEAEIDLFEAWADAASRYEMDFDRVTVSGYSMGGYGTYKLASQYPDLFARGFAVVGPADEAIDGAPTEGRTGMGSRYSEEPQNTMRITDNLRHVPLLMWAGTNDELVPYPGVRNYRRQLAEHGYRHRLDSFPGFDHFTHFLLDEWGPGRDFLGDATVEREPARVTYRAVPAFDNLRFDLIHDGAYWVRDVGVAEDADEGLVDALSLTDGYGEPAAIEYEEESTDPAANTREGARWEVPLQTRPPENALEITLEGVTDATLYVDEADVDTTEPLELRVESTHEATLTLRSGAGEATLTVPAGESTDSVVLCGTGSDGESERVGAD